MPAFARAGPVIDGRTNVSRVALVPVGEVTLHKVSRASVNARLNAPVALLAVTGLVTIAYLIFRPLAAPRSLPDAKVRAAAVDLVCAHGSDTLAYFKLRRDKQYLFSADRRAFLGYRIENGVMLCSGDPVGERASLAGVVREAVGFAERHGLKLAALGVGGDLVSLWEQAGLRAFYIGDEAVVETSKFSLEGRPIRKVRQSVSRLEKAGYRAELHEVGALDEPTLAELEAVSARWRRGAPERGFAMAMDVLGGVEQADSLVVLARDGDGVVRGFLHFVPSYGRAAVSLSAMRREHETPVRPFFATQRVAHRHDIFILVLDIVDDRERAVKNFARGER